MNLSGLIFSSVTSFVLQPQRTKRRVKRDDLDTLDEVYTGPAGGEDTFIPDIGTRHPTYNLMTFLSADVRQQPGLVVEVTLHYQGKLINVNTETYTSVPTISRYWQESEVSYTTTQFTKSHHYTGRCCTISFITNKIPSGSPTNIGLATEFLGFTNEWEIITSYNLNPQSYQPTLKRQMTCSDVRTEDRGDGWYRVTETYMSRLFPGDAVVNPSATSVFASRKGTLGGTDQEWAQAYQTAADQYQSNLAAAQALVPNISLGAGTTPQAYETGQTTGLNPEWGTAASFAGLANDYTNSPATVAAASAASSQSPDTSQVSSVYPPIYND